MPIFEVETQDGTFEVDAPSMDAAVRAIRSGRAAKAGIGYGRAAAQGALIDAPEAFGGMADLVAAGARKLVPGAEHIFAPGQYAGMAKRGGESLIGPRRQGSVGEERLSRGIRGALVTAPFAGGAGPLGAASSLLGGATGDVAQGEAEKRGLGPVGSAGVGAAIDIATGLAAKNLPRAYRGIMAMRAKPVQEMGEALAALAAKETTEAAPVAAAKAADEGVVLFDDLPGPAPAAPVAAATQTEALDLAAKAWNPSEVPRRVAVDEALKKRGYLVPENLRLPEAEDAARINIDKTIRDVAELSKGRIDELRGGIQTWDETAELGDLARKTGMDFEAVQAGTKSRGYTAAELHALNSVHEEAMTRVHFSKQAFSLDPSKENLARLQYDFGVAREVMSKLVAGSSETGRTLNIIKKFQRNFDMAKYADEIVAKSGGYENGKAIVEALDQLADPAAQAAFIRKTAPATTMEKIAEAYKASLLTGVMTHGVNAISNTAFAAQNMAEELVSAGIRTATTRSSLPARELAARLYGSKQGMREGFALMKQALLHEMPEEFSKAAEHTSRRVGAIGGRTGKFVRLPFRLLGASDAMFRTVAERQELHALAMREAYKQGKRGKSLYQEIARLVDSPTEAMLAAAKEHGSRLVFQRELGEFGKYIQHGLHKHPSSAFLIPFFKTPTNILKEAIHRTPAGAATPEIIKMWKMGGKARADAIARVGLGSAVMGWMLTESMEGRITGRGPEDPAKRAVWLTNHRPYSFKVGDKWVSYQRIEPLATMIGTAADFAYLRKDLKAEDKSFTDNIGRLMLIMADNVSNKTFLSNLVDFGLAVTNPQRYGNQFAEQFASSAVPFSGLMGNVSRTMDPALHEIRSVTDAMMNRVPGLREKLPIKISPVDGKEIRLGGSLGPDIASPLYLGAVGKDAVAAEMVKIRMGLSLPDRGDMTDDEFGVLQREAGAKAHAEAAKMIQRPWFQGLDAERKKDKLSAVYRRNRQIVRERIKRERRGVARLGGTR